MKISLIMASTFLTIVLGISSYATAMEKTDDMEIKKSTKPQPINEEVIKSRKQRILNSKRLVNRDDGQEPAWVAWGWKFPFEKLEDFDEPSNFVGND